MQYVNFSDRYAEVATLWTALSEAGESRGLVPAGLACRDTLRLEAGMPLYGQELDRNHTPYEAGLNFIVKLDKGADFMGLAALKRRAGRVIWLNPEPEGLWQYRQSIAIIRQIMGNRMYPITLEGLERSMQMLSK